MLTSKQGYEKVVTAASVPSMLAIAVNKVRLDSGTVWVHVWQVGHLSAVKPTALAKKRRERNPQRTRKIMLRTPQVNLVKVVTSHEFDIHSGPYTSRIGSPRRDVYMSSFTRHATGTCLPCECTVRTFSIHGAWAWFEGCWVGDGDGGESGKNDGSSGEHVGL